MLDMEAYRHRHANAKLADDERNALIDDLLQAVHVLQRTMERNSFVLVLIDGDQMNFLNELVKQGFEGGEQAAKKLRKSVYDYLQYDENFRLDYKIVIKVYANLRGLTKTYINNFVLPNAAAFSDFVTGFNKAHPLSDFTDAGNQKEAADTKLKETLNLYIYNVHCKQIIFGASADNAYASFLNSISVDTDVSSRIRILKGPPFSFEFKQILPRFKWTEFKDVFRSEFITNEAGQHQTSQYVQGEISPSVAQIPWPSTPRKSTDLYQKNVNVRLPILEDRSNEPRPFQAYPSPSGAQNLEHDFGEPYGQGTGYIPMSSWIDPASGALRTSEQPPVVPEIVESLIRNTNDRLRESPGALDFGVVKRRVEQEFKLSPGFWDSKEWFEKSKNIIKMTVENWVEETNSPPPKNATWMLHRFSPGRSPAAIMKDPASKEWRIQSL